MIRAAQYARYSTDKQTENSIAYQFSKIEEYCKENQIEIVASYQDEGESGTNMERSGFLEMLTAADRHEFDAVVIYDISRGSRDVADWFAFRKQMARLGVSVISATQQLGDITSPNDFLLELITVGLGEHQVLDTRQKSIAGTAQRAKKGLFCGGTPPLGYDVDRNGNYHINEREAAIVRKIYQLYAAGESYNAILQELKGEKGKKGAPIGKNSLHSILTNERYTGLYTWNKRKVKLMRKWAGGGLNPNVIRVDGAIPPIIEQNLWERVSERMKSNKRNAQNKAKREYLLSGIIECSQCGSTYVGHCSTHKRKDGTKVENRYYVCGGKYRTHTCNAENIPAAEIETFVTEQIKVYLQDVNFEEEARKIAEIVNSASADLGKERRELAEVTGQINNGLKAVMTGLDIPELRDEIDQLRNRKAELEDIIKTREAKSGASVDPAAIVAVLRNAAEEMAAGNVKNIVQQLIQKIYADPDGSYTVEIGVHINGCGGRQYVVCIITHKPEKVLKNQDYFPCVR